MEERDQTHIMDGERVLQDAVHIVCKYMSRRDLQTMSRVCNSWRHATLFEEKLRFLQFLHLSRGSEDLTQELRVLPYASLFIYDDVLENSLSLTERMPVECWYKQPTEGLHKTLMDAYRREVPNSFILIKTDKVQYDLKPADEGDILGLFLPRIDKKIQIRVCGISVADTPKIFRPDTRDGALQHIRIELGVDEEDLRDSTLLVLSVHKSEMLTVHLETIFERLRQVGELTLARLFVSRIHGYTNGVESDFSTFMVRITGSSVKTWCTELYYRAQGYQIDHNLRELQAQITYEPENQYLGFLYSLNCMYPSCKHQQHPCGDMEELIHKVKKVFPFVKFINLFKNVSANEYSSRTKVHESETFSKAYWKELRNRTSIFIISYK